MFLPLGVESERDRPCLVGEELLTGRIRPTVVIGKADRLITFQVMRRTLGTDMQNWLTEDIQSMLRHGSQRYHERYLCPTNHEKVQQAADLRTAAVLKG